MPTTNRPDATPPLTVAEYVRHQTGDGRSLVDSLLSAMRKYGASDDPTERLAGVIATAALAHLASGPDGPTEQKKRGEAEKAASIDRTRAGTKL